MAVSAPKGTRDILPDSIYKWQFVEEKFRSMCLLYGFREIRTPAFEHTELFRRGVGDTTDIVQKEMYSFRDHGGRDITLKPEGTSPVVRSFIEHKMFADMQPTKVYYETPCYRYEKPQAGRLREFHQFGLEIFGAPDMTADAEVICFAKDFLDDLGTGNVTLEINSVGCPDCRTEYRKALRDYFRPHYDELCDTCKDRFERNPMRILDCKSEEDQRIAKDAPDILDYLCDDCRTSFDDLKENLDAMGITYTVNPRIVRGLDYYTKTAFEFVSSGIGAQSTVCGGGRYDRLIEEIGGPEVPGVGFGLGIERLLLLMEENGKEIPLPPSSDVFIATLGKRARLTGLSLLRKLRKLGIKAETDDLQRRMKGQLKLAGRLAAKYTVVIGEDEVDKGTVLLKDMETRDQTEVPAVEIADVLTKKIGV